MAEAGHLARRLRELRDSRNLTQTRLAAAFSAENRVTAPTISTWESETRPASPTAARLEAYARLFATDRSFDGDVHLLAADELNAQERAAYRALDDELQGLLDLGHPREAGADTFTFEDGPVTVICPEAPPEARSPLADPANPNFTKLHQYTDQDALIELHGHLRASNPGLDVFHRIPSEVGADDLSSHVVVLGGIGWNRVMLQIQSALQQMPITQVEDDTVETGEIFVVDGERFLPTWEEADGDEEPRLKDDVGLLARLRNPYNLSRTLTLCNGVHSRGVLGAVRCLTDRRVREANERFLAERFPDGRFALLLRVPVVADAAMSPDLQNPEARLYEWPPIGGGSRGA